MTARAAERRRPVRESVRREARGAYRDAILSAAERVFARSGFYATRMAAIAEEAGVGVGTLYNYFESKELIFAAILELHHAQLQRKLDLAGEATDPVERLRGIVRAALEYFEEHGGLLNVLTERGGVGEYDMERLAGAGAARRYEEFLELLEKNLRAAVRARKIRPDVDPRFLVAALSGAMNGATYAWLKRGRRGGLSSATDELFSLFLEGARHA